jgi:hypothetical protein
MLTSGRFQVRPFAESDLPSFVEAVLESTATVGKWMPWAHPNYTTESPRFLRRLFGLSQPTSTVA